MQSRSQVSELQATAIETPLGAIGLAWTPIGLRHVQLPERDGNRTMARLQARAAAPLSLVPTAGLPEPIARLARQIADYASGDRVDSFIISVDWSGIDPFRLDVYRAAARLGYGETSIYGALAEAAGHKGMAREAGQALGSNPVPIIIPCHRILAAGGKLGGFSAPGGVATKKLLLEREGVSLDAPASPQAAFAF